MDRRSFIISTLKAACITYASTYISKNYEMTSRRYRNSIEKTLAAFVETVIPGCDLEDEYLLAGFYDKTIPMAKYLRVFTNRISRNTKRLGYKKIFRELDRNERTQVIEYGYDRGGVDRELFHAGIYLSQVSVYCGIFNKDTSASFIDFRGAQKDLVDKSIWHYTSLENAEIPMTKNGNHP